MRVDFWYLFIGENIEIVLGKKKNLEYNEQVHDNIYLIII